MNIADKLIVITGAAGGIGAAVAREFAAKGARLVLSDLDLNTLMPLADELSAVAVQCDVTHEESIQ